MEDLKHLGLLIVGILVAFTVVMTMVAYTVLAERRILGFIQGRLGPNRVGPGGFLQPIADLLKFIFKEDIVPDKSTRFVYFLAPTIATTAALMTIVVYPFGPDVHLPLINKTIQLVVARFDVALLYVLGVTSVGVYGIALAGWSSNNKYSLMGGLRSSAQMISYELALGLGLIGVILQSGTLDLYSIVEQQSGHLGITGWNLIWVQPLGFFVYLIAAIAETNRVPFDLPEAETELVAGFHTEYSAMKFALFFLAEYVNMFTVSMLATTLFLGGWNGPFVHQLPWLGVFYFLGKVILFLFFYIWLRGTLPRFRFDQLMNFGWKFLVPLAIINIVLTATMEWSGAFDYVGSFVKTATGWGG
ncbi:MAG TPA: NADH-quinone oxidoreductase subunit NuoH [Pyrinomonadaceae bacterium]|nr:NADH-quinone oxidoreductase subunit NuoH [Pyrinomonadaceae bacterium]